MRAYELMYIVRPDLDEESTKAVIERFQNVIKDNGGEVEKVDEMGKRRLAYEIEGYNDGYYVVVNFKSNPDLVAELERQLRLNDNVIRHLVVREDE
ncbi:30S ribosomal protein S6 [Caldalkalibacillus thermarum TA2.A1]|uniref:Small ribosomal subunit protein bS6 n=1 Tax=Caldalkalibacillus thermarum (strain TA2.A1) TaxID=986075 RepID=F5L8F7_CALTT|nr:30S ribosomal protein S6 [Caldalkalibacillus thermarum]EGL82390.1 30S ribosomal protein S6 [Caldalkalibacillus thermarum TA2.A1]QZT34266.1 30S ribosomal protein S6 [Caldalkalibacillus thermarum TA2.A1]GGK30278.1 30S ribosomal protein S6 [Caldalkalibacillus thermarum]